MMKALMLAVLGALGNTIVIEQAISQTCNDAKEISTRQVEKLLLEEITRAHYYDVRMNNYQPSIQEWRPLGSGRGHKGWDERKIDANVSCPLFDIQVRYLVGPKQFDGKYICYTKAIGG